MVSMMIDRNLEVVGKELSLFKTHSAINIGSAFGRVYPDCTVENSKEQPSPGEIKKEIARGKPSVVRGKE